MEYKILTSSAGIDQCYTGVVRALEKHVLLYLAGNWRPGGGVACCLVDDRFIVMQVMVREVSDDDDG